MPTFASIDMWFRNEADMAEVARLEVNQDQIEENSMKTALPLIFTQSQHQNQHQLPIHSMSFTIRVSFLPGIVIPVMTSGVEFTVVYKPKQSPSPATTTTTMLQYLPLVPFGAAFNTTCTSPTMKCGELPFGIVLHRMPATMEEVALDIKGPYHLTLKNPTKTTTTCQVNSKPVEALVENGAFRLRYGFVSNQTYVFECPESHLVLPSHHQHEHTDWQSALNQTIAVLMGSIPEKKEEEEEEDVEAWWMG